MAVLRSVLGWVAFAFLAVVILWWGASGVTGDTLTLVRWLNYAAPWLGIAGVLTGAAAFLLKCHVLGVACIGVAVFILVPDHIMFHGQAEGAEACEARGRLLDVVSYNMMTRNADMRSAARIVADFDADILFLQEVNDPAFLFDELEEDFSGEPVHFARDDDLKLMMVSRFPFVDLSSEGKIQKATVQTPDGPLFLRNLHAIKAVGSDKEQLKTIGQLTEDVSSLSWPVIVAGDFNMTAENDGYKILRTWLRNAHEEAGTGFGFTFPAPNRSMGAFFPFVRIDHIFVSRHFDVLRSTVDGRYGGSDHFPITARLCL